MGKISQIFFFELLTIFMNFAFSYYWIKQIKGAKIENIFLLENYYLLYYFFTNFCYFIKKLLSPLREISNINLKSVFKFTPNFATIRDTIKSNSLIE